MNQIRDIRLTAGLTQVDLAKRLGVTQATLSRWESEKDPKAHHVFAVKAAVEPEGEEAA